MQGNIDCKRYLGAFILTRDNELDLNQSFHNEYDKISATIADYLMLSKEHRELRAC
jgi:hypothetical protein